MNRVLCSTGTMIGRPNGRDITLLGRYKDYIECDGFEFLMYDTWYDRLDDIRRYMSGLDALIPSFHVEKSVGELISRNEPGDTKKSLELFEINCRLAQELGSSKLVLHLWNGIHSDKDIAHNINCYRYLRDISDKFGLMLTVENVVCNHKDPMSNIKSLSDAYPEALFTFDTKMAQFHSQLDRLYDESSNWLAKRIRHVHANDYSGGYMDWSNLKTKHIGQGTVDFKSFFRFMKTIGYTGDFTVEATSFDQSGDIDIESLNKSLNAVRKYSEM